MDFKKSGKNLITVLSLTAIMLSASVALAAETKTDSNADAIQAKTLVTKAKTAKKHKKKVRKVTRKKTKKIVKTTTSTPAK